MIVTFAFSFLVQQTPHQNMSFLCTTRPTSGKLQIMYKGVSRFPKARKHLHSYDGETEQTLNGVSLLKPASIAPKPYVSIYFQGPPVSCMTSPRKEPDDQAREQSSGH